MDGTEKRRITQGEWRVLSSPSGRHIFWCKSTEEGNEVWTLAVEHGENPVLVTTVRGLGDVDWLTDEALIFCTYTERAQFEVWTVNRDGTELRQILGGK